MECSWKEGDIILTEKVYSKLSLKATICTYDDKARPHMKITTRAFKMRKELVKQRHLVKFHATLNYYTHDMYMLTIFNLQWYIHSEYF